MNSGLTSGLASAPLRTQYLRVGARAVRGTVLGSGSATGTGSFAAIGGTASAPDSVSFGGSATAVNARAFLGTASGLRSITFGGTASGADSFSGPVGSASGQYSTALGVGAQATGVGSTAFGTNCSSSGNASSAIGFTTTANGYGSVSLCRNSRAESSHSIAMGFGALASFEGCRAFSSGTNLAKGLTSGYYNQIIEIVLYNTSLGSNQVTLTNNSTFSIPNWTSHCGVIIISGSRTDGVCCFFIRQYAAKNVNGTTSELASPSIIGTDITNGCSVNLSVSDATDSMLIQCQGDTDSFTGITGSEATDTINFPGHSFRQADEIAFLTLTGGAGLATNTKYFVNNVTTNSFKVTTGFATNTPVNFTTDITDATIVYQWNWSADVRMVQTGLSRN